MSESEPTAHCSHFIGKETEGQRQEDPHRKWQSWQEEKPNPVKGPSKFSVRDIKHTVLIETDSEYMSFFVFIFCRLLMKDPAG